VTTFFLVRHAAHQAGTDRLVGRTPGISLSESGRSQARRLAERLSGKGVTAIHAGPRERTVETAEAIAQLCRCPVVIAEALDEVDFGVWAGRSFRELEDDREWNGWNAARASASTPAGATMAEIMRRVITHMRDCAESEPEGRVVLVSHAEPIRAAVMHYLGMALSAHDRVQIDLASITTLTAGEWGARLSALNERISE
jgi:broad specificity phosphatase PhoE